MHIKESSHVWRITVHNCRAVHNTAQNSFDYFQWLKQRL